MRVTRMKSLFKRELTDIFRDRKTLIMMVLVPLLLYPLLIVGMTLITSAVASDQEEKLYEVAFYQVDEQDKIKDVLEKNKEELSYELTIVSTENPEKDLMEKKLDAYVSSEEKDGKVQYYIHYLSAETDSCTAADVLFDGMELLREELRKEKVAELNLDETAVLYPISYEQTDMSTKEESMGSMLGSIIPMLMITSICLGAIYPAIDVTAGEKERGTLETLLTLPVTNFELIMSKFLAVSVIACISAFLNIISMAGAFGFMFSFLADSAGGVVFDFASFIPAIVISIVIMMVFALFVTAACMCVCIFAKSFKEANNYITPVLLVFMFASYSAMLPDFKLTTGTAAIPIINITLLIKDIFNFQYNYGLFAIVFFTNLAYSLLTIMVLGKIYNSEAILFSEGFTSLKIFNKRSEMKKGQMPRYGDLILLICISLLAIFYIGSYATVKWGFWGVFVQQLIILLIPICYGWYMKTDFKKLFAIKIPGIKDIFAAICVFAGGFCINLLLSNVLSAFMKESAENLQTTFDYLLEQPFVLIVFVMSVMPAVGEELMFRGFTFGTLKEKNKPVVAMLITSIIFGCYHFSLVKLIPTGFLGFLLAMLVYRTGSIFTGMLMHFLNNFVSLFVSKYEEQLVAKYPDFMDLSFGLGQNVNLILMMVIGVVFLVVGFMLTSGSKKKL
ncbi:MAG: CPBP family intramembrane metalloprotease [Lachnospiraceae bacterium]|nr:CPBP family intramembrane metalloprotease [Lachnospiraceae bacterium]